MPGRTQILRCTSVAMMGWVAMVSVAGCGERETNPPPEPVAQIDEGAAASPVAPDIAVDDMTAQLDAMFADRWSAAKVEVSPAISDEGFLRRASLDLMGRIPTVEERAAFLAAGAETRRADAVARMLSSEDFVTYWGRRHAQLLLGDDENLPPRFMEGLTDWAEQALRDGAGWDRMVDDLLTATGPLSDDPAGVFLVALERQGGDADVASRVGEAILGVQIECAQCHDHPYADFTKDDFWGMTAYFARTRVRIDRTTKPPMPRVVDTRRGETRIASVDGGPADRKIGPSFLGHPETDRAVVAHDVTVGDRRTLFAHRVLASDLTAKAAVGRVWTDLFGAGLQHPWNDLGGPDQRHDPALERLATAFVEHDWDLRWLLATIVLSEPYGRSATGSGEGRPEAEAAFARARIRPLSAEQIYGSLMVASGFDDYSGRRFRQATGLRPLATLREVQSVFPAPGKQTGMDGEVTVAQALWLLNGGMTNAAAEGETELGRMVEQIASQGDDTATKVASLYHRLYGREPSDEERDELVALLDAEPDPHAAPELWADVAFAMLASTEFVTNH